MSFPGKPPLRMNPNRPDAYRAVWWISADRQDWRLITNLESSRLPADILTLRAQHVMRKAGFPHAPGDIFVIGDSFGGGRPLEG